MSWRDRNDEGARLGGSVGEVLFALLTLGAALLSALAVLWPRRTRKPEDG